jgi:hypothetical protein
MEPVPLLKLLQDYYIIIINTRFLKIVNDGQIILEIKPLYPYDARIKLCILKSLLNLLNIESNQNLTLN